MHVKLAMLILMSTPSFAAEEAIEVPSRLTQKRQELERKLEATRQLKQQFMQDSAQDLADYHAATTVAKANLGALRHMVEDQLFEYEVLNAAE